MMPSRYKMIWIPHYSKVVKNGQKIICKEFCTTIEYLNFHAKSSIINEEMFSKKHFFGAKIEFLPWKFKSGSNFLPRKFKIEQNPKLNFWPKNWVLEQCVYINMTAWSSWIIEKYDKNFWTRVSKTFLLSLLWSILTEP